MSKPDADEDGEEVFTLDQILAKEEEEEAGLIETANAVLGAADDEKCSYSQALIIFSKIILNLFFLMTIYQIFILLFRIINLKVVSFLNSGFPGIYGTSTTLLMYYLCAGNNQTSNQLKRFSATECRL